ncbi:hypothetical protein CCB80_14815 [Armatimonadetes bacterium Uphvl-Ar1]|nr:hypothetical protein CCB80_14815 [Armatimonadetes bacterium Uphvl-Ar1]
MKVYSDEEIVGKRLSFRHDNDIDRWDLIVLGTVAVNLDIIGIHVKRADADVQSVEYVVVPYFAGDNILEFEQCGSVQPVRVFEHHAGKLLLDEKNYLGRGTITLSG